MPTRDLSQAARDESVTRRYWSHVTRVDGSTCWIWIGAISGRGHGRLWVRDGHVVIAHRFAWVLSHPDEEVPAVVRHGCDNPLCQNPAHLQPGDATENRRDYFARRGVPGSPLNDVRGSRGRAAALRAAARNSGRIEGAVADGLSVLDRDQPPLW